MDYEEAEKILARVVDTLRRERERQELPKLRLEQLAGISRRAIGMIESGERSPTLISCLRIADALDLDLAKVLRDAKKASR